MVSGSRNTNHIGFLLLDNGEYTRGGKVIEEEIIIRFFSSLYSPEVRVKLFVEGIDWSSISTREDEGLVVPFAMDEIKKVVFSYNRN